MTDDIREDILDSIKAAIRQTNLDRACSGKPFPKVLDFDTTDAQDEWIKAECRRQGIDRETLLSKLVDEALRPFGLIEGSKTPDRVH